MGPMAHHPSPTSLPAQQCAETDRMFPEETGGGIPRQTVRSTSHQIGEFTMLTSIGLRLLCLVIGYGFGCIQSAYIIGRMKGIDIRNEGSGNSGTTNATRVMGRKIGFIVLLLDFAKSLICLAIIHLMFGTSYPDMVYLLKMWAFAGVVLGHDYPFYMNFRGGKGVAVIAGFVFSFHISLLVPAIISFGIPFLVTHHVSLGSLVVYTVTFLLVVCETWLGWYHLGSAAMALELCVIMGALTVLAYYRHSANIKRLRDGTESSMYLTRDREKRDE